MARRVPDASSTPPGSRALQVASGPAGGVQRATLRAVRADCCRGKVLTAALTWCLVAPMTPGSAQPAGPPGVGGRDTIALGYLLPDSGDTRQKQFDLGVRFGVAEARHAATLLRRHLVVVELDGSRLRAARPDGPRGAVLTGSSLPQAEFSVLIAPALSDSVAAQLAAWAARPGHAVITSTASPNAVCAMPVFRTGPDSATHASAVRAALRASSIASPAGGTASESVTSIELWHPDLVRFGARQLSDRYMQHYGTPMTSAAWEGWMAVKMAWESALRARDGDMAAALDRGAFDGHKGAALRFDAGDRILRQPLIVVATEAGTAGSSASPRGATKALREIAWPPARPAGGGDPVGAAPSGCPASPNR